MNVTILTIGSRGDIQPYVALGVGLHAAGHKIKVATNLEFEPLVRKFGLDYFPLHGDFRQIVASDAGQEALHSGNNFVSFIRRYVASTEKMMQQLLLDAWQACQDAEAIIYAAFSFFGYHIAEKLKIPSIAAYLYPVTPTAEFPSLGAPAVKLGRSYNRQSYIIGQQIFWQPYRKIINRWREETLKLPPVPFWGTFREIHRQRYPILYGFSPTFITPPADWGDWVHITGYWFLDDLFGWKPPQALLDFLEAGAPPIYIGFGSMASKNAEQETDMVVRALHRAGCRGILATGWGGLEVNRQDDLYVIESIPHQWLFPQVAAVVHHGGAGTTAAGLRSGVPAIITPFFGDQFFWARRIFEHGLGPAPIPHKQLSVENLADALLTVKRQASFKKQSEWFAQKIRVEDGVKRAVEVFHQVIEKGYRKP